MSSINKRYEKQPSVVWADWFILNKNVLNLQWQLNIKVKFKKLQNTELDHILQFKNFQRFESWTSMSMIIKEC